MNDNSFFCGEIYNRSQLEARERDGVELLSAIYARNGAVGFTEVRGPFAACFKVGEKTVLVRDPMGISWLYYWTKNPTVCGTSVRDLLNKGVPRKLSLEGVWSCLLGGCMQEPFTMIEDVRSLPPGCALIVEPDGTQKIERYWQPSFEMGKWNSKHEVEAAVKSKLEESVALLRGNDETPAAFLSGGIDSSTNVALLRRGYSGRIRTFCVVHEDPRTDERKWAKMVADQNGTEHTEFMLTDDMMRKGVGEALEAYDQPSLDGLNVYFASKFAAEVGARKVFSGEGADELFMGYWQFAKQQQAYKWTKRFKYIPELFGRGLSVNGRSERTRKFAQMFGCRYDPYFLTRRQFSPAWVLKLLSDSRKVDLENLFNEQMSAVGTADIDFNGDLLNRISWLETRHNNNSMFMRDGFQLGGAVGVEGLYPMMDHTLVELLFTIPSRYKCDKSVSKPLLVNAAGDGLPDAVVHRPKQGFSIPIDKYCREGLKDELDWFVRTGGTGLFNQNEIAKVWQRYLAGKISWMRIWHLFVIDSWCRLNKVYL